MTGQMSLSSESMMDKLMSQSMFPPKSQVTSFIIHIVLRPFCLVESHSQDAATNAGVLSVNLTTVIKALYTGGLNSKRVRNSDGRWHSVFEWGSVFYKST